MLQRGSYLACLILSVTGCASSNTIVVRVDDDSAETREVQKMDCRVYDTQGESMRVGIDFGLLFGLVHGGPYVEQAKVSGVKWDKSVNHMVAQYKEVCSRFNSGGLSQSAYSQRIAEIDQLWAEAQGIRQSADEAVRSHGKESFNELEQSTGDGGVVEQQHRIAGAIDALASRLGAQ